MKCPECHTAIKQKDYDAAFEWYECPSCEGCFTGDEIMEAELASRDVGGRSNRGRNRSADSGGDSGSGRTATKKVVAKGKKRQSEIEADAEAIAAYEKRTTETVVVADKKTKHRDEVSTGQVVQIMADEIEVLYEEIGWTPLSRDAAEDKALTLWRNLTVHDGITAREKAVPVALCGDHS